MPVYPLNFGDIKERVLRSVGDLVGAGTASGGSTTTIDDAVNFIDATDTRLKGVHWYIRNGAGQSQEGRATAFTPADDRLTIPTQTTGITSTSEYLLSRRFSQSDVLQAIRDSLMALGSYAKDYVDQSLITGSPLVNATFYDNSGTFPNGWTQAGTGGTFTQEATITKHGRYSAKMLSDGTNECSFYQDAPFTGPYRGKTAYGRAWVFTNTASRVNLTLDDGIDTTTGVVTIGDSNRGWGTAELETPALAVSDRATRIRLTANITAGGAVTAYFSGMWITPAVINEWDVPAGSPGSIHRVNVEGAWNNEWNGHVANNAIHVVRETTRRLRFPDMAAGRILDINGRTNWADHAAAATDDDTTFDGAAEWLIAEAAYRLLLRKPRSEDKDLLGMLRADADGQRPEARLAPAGSIFIERQ